MNMATPEKLAEIADHVRDGARGAGRVPGVAQVAAKVRVSLHPDRERARAKLRQLAAFYTVADHYQDMLRSSGFEQDVDLAIEAFKNGGLGEAQRTISDAVPGSVAAHCRDVDRGAHRAPQTL